MALYSSFVAFDDAALVCTSPPAAEFVVHPEGAELVASMFPDEFELFWQPAINRTHTTTKSGITIFMAVYWLFTVMLLSTVVIPVMFLAMSPA